MTKRKHGDRSDGTLIKDVDPLFTTIPHLLKTRTGSQVFFDFELPTDNIEKFIKKHRKEGINLSIMDVVVASLVRLYANKPTIHRFVVGKRIFAKKDIEIAMMIKKEMSEKAPEAAIKVVFNPTDTVSQVHNKLKTAIVENKGIVKENDTELFEKSVSRMPQFLRSLIIELILFLDKHGLMPAAILKLSPFHTSAYISNLGSLGIQPVKHHLYDVGTASLFLTFGAKYKKIVSDKNGVLKEEKFIAISVTVDERICDGYNMAVGFKFLQRHLLKPELLED